MLGSITKDYYRLGSGSGKPSRALNIRSQFLVLGDKISFSTTLICIRINNMIHFTKSLKKRQKKIYI